MLGVSVNSVIIRSWSIQQLNRKGSQHLSKQEYKQAKHLSLKISDELSGIKSYREP